MKSARKMKKIKMNNKIKGMRKNDNKLKREKNPLKFFFPFPKGYIWFQENLKENIKK